jgi:hypothetical protein
MSEHSEQCALIEWANLVKNKYPELEWLFAVPNGGHRHPLTAVKLKKEGVKSGVFDLFLPVSRGGYHGLFVEMKFGKNELTDNQIEFKHFIFSQGYCNGVFWQWTDARDFIVNYLEMK